MSLGEWSLPGTETHRVTPSDGGPPYRILVAPAPEPESAAGHPSETRAPTLYLLDGGALFGTLVETHRMRRNRPRMTGVGPATIVGISHPGAHPYDRARRQFDYTPKWREGAVIGPGGTVDPDSVGGGDAFLRFLTEDLHPFVETRYSVDPERRVLIGHSLAGFFALGAFLAAPPVWTAYAALSPSIWWDRDHLERGLASVAERLPPTPPRVVISVAEFDQELAPWQRDSPDAEAVRVRRHRRRMVDDAAAFADALEARCGAAVHTRFAIEDGADHASSVPMGLSRWLRYLLESDEHGHSEAS